MSFFTTLLAERSVVKNRMPKRFSFARSHVTTAVEFLCGCRLRVALENGGDALPIERPDEAKPVVVFQKVGLIFAVKTWAEIQHCLDAVGIMLCHDTVPVVEYQTRTVELPSLLKFTCPTLLQAAMHCV